MKLELIETSPRQWKVTDDNGISVTFQHGRFNETQHVDLNTMKELSAQEGAAAMNRIAEWLRNNAYDMAMTETAGGRLFRMRIQSGLSYNLISDVSGVDIETIKRIEKGFGSLEIYDKLIGALERISG